MNLAIQTGRNFGPYGNRIALQLSAQAEGMRAIFVDHDRSIQGVMVMHDLLLLLEDRFALCREVIRRIDVGAYDYGIAHPASADLRRLARKEWVYWRTESAYVDVTVVPKNQRRHHLEALA